MSSTDAEAAATSTCSRPGLVSYVRILRPVEQQVGRILSTSPVAQNNRQMHDPCRRHSWPRLGRLFPRIALPGGPTWPSHVTHSLLARVTPVNQMVAAEQGIAAVVDEQHGRDLRHGPAMKVSLAQPSSLSAPRPAAPPTADHAWHCARLPVHKSPGVRRPASAARVAIRIPKLCVPQTDRATRIELIQEPGQVISRGVRAGGFLAGILDRATNAIAGPAPDNEANGPLVRRGDQPAVGVPALGKGFAPVDPVAVYEYRADDVGIFGRQQLIEARAPNLLRGRSTILHLGG